MTRVVSNNVLVIPPFECAWLSGEELQFQNPGRGCLSFEARAENDITVVFTEDIGARHYRTEQSRNYIVVLGSHKNRRVKIEVDCQPVADVGGSIDVNGGFAKYWIDINQGVISVGRGDPGRNLLLRWVDPHPDNHRVKHVGLSSWDRYVGYRNISLLPSVDFVAVAASAGADSATALCRQVSGALSRFVNCADLSDIQFVVRRSFEGCCDPPPAESKYGEDDADVVVFAHAVLLASCCSKLADRWRVEDCSRGCPALPANTPVVARHVHLPHVECSVLISLLHFAYSGKTQIPFQNMAALRDLAEEVGLYPLVSTCEARLVQTLQHPEKCSSPTECVELVYETAPAEEGDTFVSPLSLLPLDVHRLRGFYETGEFSDVTLIVEGTKVAHAHRLVLSAWSDPFYKMFTIGMRESLGKEIYLEDTCPETVQALLQFIYTLTLDDGAEASFLVSLLLLADRFCVDPLKAVCSTYLVDHVSEDLACMILHAGVLAGASQSLLSTCEAVLARNFDYCVINVLHDLHKLDYAAMARILQHQELLVTSEEVVLDAVMIWAASGTVSGWEAAETILATESIEAVFLGRREEMERLLQFVYFPLMPRSLLNKLASSLLASSIVALEDLLAEALQFTAFGHEISADMNKASHHEDVQEGGRVIKLQRGNVHFLHRLSNFKELLYISDGDRNGVCYYAGTTYGAHPWMNPVVIKTVVATASSPPSRYTDPKALLSGNYQCTSFAGPCIENGHITAWWRLDLREDHRLICNYYTVRQDGSSNFMRSWNLEGSLDGIHWHQLVCHKDDKKLCRPGQYASWPVVGPQASIPFRIFRVILQGPTSSRSTPWNLSLAYLELYGYFR